MIKLDTLRGRNSNIRIMFKETGCTGIHTTYRHTQQHAEQRKAKNYAGRRYKDLSYRHAEQRKRYLKELPHSREKPTEKYK